MGKNLKYLLLAIPLFAIASWDINFDEDFASATRTIEKPDVLDGIIAWWKMNDNTASTTVINSWANRTNGVATRNTSLISTNGVSSTALLFNGVSDYISVNSYSELSGMTEITVSFWAKLEVTTGDRVLVHKDDITIQRSYMLFYDGSLIKGYFFGPAGDTFFQSTYNLDDINWHHVCFTFAGSTKTVKIYIDSVSLSVTKNTNLASSINSTTSKLFLGSYKDGLYSTKGVMDDVRIYNRAISSNEVNTIYQKFKP